MSRRIDICGYPRFRPRRPMPDTDPTPPYSNCTRPMCPIRIEQARAIPQYATETMCMFVRSSPARGSAYPVVRCKRRPCLHQAGEHRRLNVQRVPSQTSVAAPMNETNCCAAGSRNACVPKSNTLLCRRRQVTQESRMRLSEHLSRLARIFADDDSLGIADRIGRHGQIFGSRLSLENSA